jgi:hypothetical protein
MKKDWKIRGSTIFGLVLLIVFIGFIIPIGIEYLAPFFGVFYYFRLKKQGRIKDFDYWELGLIVAYTFLMLIGSVITGLFVLASIPWFKLILVGMAADLFASLLGAVPVFGDILSAILVFILVLTVIGGLQGVLLGLVMAFISILPGPTLGANTMFLIAFKIFSSLIFGWGTF